MIKKCRTMAMLSKKRQNRSVRSIATVSAKIDSDFKRDYERILDELGLSMTAKFQVFAKSGRIGKVN